MPTYDANGYNRDRVLSDERACGVRAPKHVYYVKKDSLRVTVDAIYGDAWEKNFRRKHARSAITILAFVDTLPVNGLEPFKE